MLAIGRDMNFIIELYETGLVVDFIFYKYKFLLLLFLLFCWKEKEVVGGKF